MRDVFMSKNFNEKFYYEGNDLGFTFEKSETCFRVWAPLAEHVSLALYASGDVSDKKAVSEHVMISDMKGTWTATVKGNLDGMFYTYRVQNPGLPEYEVGDPYAKAVGVNGHRSAIVDLEHTNPDGWYKDRKPFFMNATDCVIYELHVRDLSSHKASGVLHVGKFLEFTEDVPSGKGGITRGLNHIVELGATHVHLLPAFDFGIVDESIPDNTDFNWGYDPINYNVPEGSYATNAFKPEVRIREFKEMVMAMHEKGLRVVMDVVYNHTLENEESKFHKLVPGYYYRMNPDGSFMNGSLCGSETASERPMMRKYIVDSVKYWAKEYHVDGFRFDLMGLHDVETMNEVRTELSNIDETILVYGEGWDMGNLPEKDRAIQKHAHRMPGIGFFNDHIRDCLKGPWNHVKGHGFVDGRKKQERKVMKGICGSINYNKTLKDYNDEPGQSINYVEAHDNNTLWDKLLIANPKADQRTLKKMDMLASAIVLMSQGVPFLSSGQEFLRTKHGDENSFRSPDSINMLDWSRKLENIDVFEYCKGLVQLRKSHPAFRMPHADMIRRHLVFIKASDNMVAYVIKDHANGDQWNNILVVHNANRSVQKLQVPDAEWTITVQADKAGCRGIDSLFGTELWVAAVSTLVMHTDDAIEVEDMFKG